jgi:tRNA (cytidine/uridine-2'-O-)-methyltransferase
MTLHIALIQPQIPPNTGNIARLCAGADVPLHLIGPLGFEVDDRHVKRAGLDYWDKVDLWIHADWFEFRHAIARERCLYFSSNAEQEFTSAPFAGNSVLIFGNESDGLPARILEKHPERCFRVPMPGGIRSVPHDPTLAHVSPAKAESNGRPRSSRRGPRKRSRR